MNQELGINWFIAICKLTGEQRTVGTLVGNVPEDESLQTFLGELRVVQNECAKEFGPACERLGCSLGKILDDEARSIATIRSFFASNPELPAPNEIEGDIG